MKVKIKKWNAVATWRWDLPEDDVCGICQVHFDGTCPTCKYPGDDCSLLSGKCGHNFHMHCIMEWIKQDSAKGQCPMCRQKFEWNEAGAGQQQPQVHEDNEPLQTIAAGEQ
ncbi:anaphase-promoting complex subunit 11 [Xylariaceae sp. FL1651]|nr:anaphase-promoting complex subunit 11 [Xylariaceae sp. FL1651]